MNENLNRNSLLLLFSFNKNFYFQIHKIPNIVTRLQIKHMLRQSHVNYPSFLKAAAESISDTPTRANTVRNQPLKHKHEEDSNSTKQKPETD